MFKNIIIDWSGVIADTFSNWYTASMAVFKAQGTEPIKREEARAEIDTQYVQFYKKYIPNFSLETAQKTYKQAITACPTPHPFPGIVSTLKKLKNRDINLVVLSGDLKETLLKELRSFDLEDVFLDVVYDVHDKYKIIPEILKKHLFNPKETLFIGDLVGEVEAGKKSSVGTVAATWGFNPREKLKQAKPDFLIDTPAELEAIVLH